MCAGFDRSVHAEEQVSQLEAGDNPGGGHGMSSAGRQDSEWLFLHYQSMDVGSIAAVCLYFCEDVSGVFLSDTKEKDSIGCDRHIVCGISDFLSGNQRNS